MLFLLSGKRNRRAFQRQIFGLLETRQVRLEISVLLNSSMKSSNDNDEMILIALFPRCVFLWCDVCDIS